MDRKAMTRSRSVLLWGGIILLMVFQHAARLAMVYAAAPLTDGSPFSRKMLTMLAMTALWLLLVGHILTTKARLPVFPARFGKGYIVLSVITALILVATPSNYLVGFTAIMELIYGSIVTPIYEETIFRGVIWERLKVVCRSERSVYLLTSLLFMLWHLGYMLPSLAEGNLFAVGTKLAAGAVYGLVLGFVRLKSGNMYLPVLIHGLMNIFAF